MSVAASLIMLLVGVIVSLIVSVRVQLALLTHYPTADWPSMRS